MYNIYDNCPRGKAFLDRFGISMFQLVSALNTEMDTGIPATTTLAELTGTPALVGATSPTGGYPWSCGGMDATKIWLQRADVVKALHLSAPGQSSFQYHSSGPASITLHPELVRV